MPFTLSHSAAALPLARRPLVPAALVAGTLVPDVALFVSLPSYASTHSLAGVFTSDLLLGIALLLVWYGLLREPLLALAPAWVGARVPPRRRWSVRDLFGVPVSICIGAGTHVLWDSFTHVRGIAIWGWEWLGARPFGLLPVYDILQVISSVAGLVMLAWWVACRPRLATPAPRQESPSRPFVLGAVVAVACVCSILYASGAISFGLRAIVYEAIVGAVTGTAFVLGGYATAWRVRMALRG
ncbi:MAG TPA: DUF4184 family protein [Actinomycetota bacterium]|jgi:hypothetical protein